MPILFLSLMYVYVCVHVCFFMKSLTHDFDYIDNFVTFVLCLKDSSTPKSNYKINNSNRVLQEGHVIAYPLCTPTITQYLTVFSQTNSSGVLERFKTVQSVSSTQNILIILCE